MLELIDAFNAAVKANPACTAGLIGGWYWDQLPVNQRYPYGIMTGGSVSQADYDTSSSYEQQGEIEVEFFCASLSQISGCVAGFLATFNHKPLTLATERVLFSKLTGESTRTELDEDNENLSKRIYTITFGFFLQRQVSS